MRRKARKSVPHYTYRESSKQSEKLIYKRIGIVSLATIIIGTIIWFWGTSFINLLGILAKPAEQLEAVPTLSIPISKPAIKPLPEATNDKSITVEGSTSGGEEVFLEGPEGLQSTVSESNGSFSFTKVALKSGLNLLKVYVRDTDGNKLEESFVITYDNKPPQLDIIQPKDGQIYPGVTKTIEILGKTEEESIVFINELQAIVNPGGQFTFNYPVKKGTNTLKIKATDKADNTKEDSLTVIVSGT